MVGAGIAGSLITSALSELASVSAHTIFDKIKDRISADDKELLEEELISSLKKRFEGDEISSSDIEAVLNPIDEYVVDSVYQSRSDIAEQIAVNLRNSNDGIAIPAESDASTIARESIDEALENWIEYISQDGRAQKYVLEGIWENQSQLQEIQSKLDAVADYQGSQTRFSKIEVTDYDEAAAEVSKHLESGQPLTAEIFVSRSEIPERLTNNHYLVIGRRGMGKTRTLDHLQTKFLEENDIDQVIIPDDDFMAVGDSVDFSKANLDGDVLLIWDDIQGLRSDELEKTIRQSILRLSQRVEESGNSLYIVASLQSEFLDEIPNLDRTKDRAWDDFEELRLEPLSDETVEELFSKTADAHDLGLDDTEREALIREIQYTDPSPLYVESVVSSIGEDQDISAQIDALPNDVEGIWEEQYDQLRKEHPETRFVLWAIDLLRMGAIPLYKPTLRKLFSEVFDRDRFEFQLPIEILKQKQWIWETEGPEPEISQTVYETRAAQMSAVSEDVMRVLEEFIDFLLESFPSTIPDEVEDWIPNYYANTAISVIAISKTKPDDSAERLLDQAVELDPYNPMIRNNFATYYQLRGEPEKSVDHYEVALSVAPNWIELRNTYAATLDEYLGRKFEAKEQYQKVIESDYPEPEAYFNLANLHRDLGQFEEAKRHYENALYNGFLSPDVYNNLGMSHKESGDYRKALRVIEEGLEVAEFNSRLLTNLATIYIEINRPDKAVEILEPGLESKNDSSIHGSLSLAYSNLGEREKAIHHAEKAKAAHTSNLPFEEGLLEDLDITDVREDPQWEQRPELLRIFNHLAGKENYAKAWQKGNEVLDTEYDSSIFRCRLAGVAEELDFIEDAERHYQKAIELGSNRGVTYRKYANFLKHQNRLEEAEAQFKAGLVISDDPELYNDYGLLLMQMEEPERVEEVLSESLELLEENESDDEQAAQIYNNYAQVLASQGREQVARKHFDKAMELNEEYPSPRIGLGQIEFHNGDIDSGIEYLEEGIRLHALNGETERWMKNVILVIEFLVNAGRIQGAIEKCEYGIEHLEKIGWVDHPFYNELRRRNAQLADSIEN